MPSLDEKSEVNLFEYLRVIWKWKWIVFVLPLACAIISLYAALNRPRVYKATVSILSPPKQQVSSLIQGLRGLAGGLFPFGSNTNMFFSILESRKVLDRVIEKFQLVKVYGLENQFAPFENARRQIKSSTEVESDNRGLIKVTVTDPDPRLAADIANFYAQSLDDLNSRLNVSRATSNRRFVEKRLSQKLKDLSEIEEKLVKFKTENGAILLEAQIQASMIAGERLKAKIAESEVQLEEVRGFATDIHPGAIRLRERILELKRQLGRTQYAGGRQLPGLSDDHGRKLSELAVPMARAPGLVVVHGRLMREIKTQEKVVEFLIEQYEQAKIEESRDTPTVQILDPAEPPKFPARRGIITKTATVYIVSFLASIVIVFLCEYVTVIFRGVSGISPQAS